MAKSFQGAWGNFSGKIGNIIGRIRRGEQTLSIYQRNVDQPNTDSQLAQRLRFTLVVQLLTSMMGWLNVMGKPLAKIGQTGYNAIMALCYSGNPFTGSYPAITLDYTKIKLSKGALELGFDLVANVDGNDIVVNWTDNSGQGNAKENDLACIAMYNEVKKIALTNLQAAKREDAAANITVPTSWNTDTLHVWIAFKNEGGDLVSDSSYLGSFTV